MQDQTYITFKSKIGLCAISWKDCAITGFFLPEKSDEYLLKKLKSLFKSNTTSTPPLWIKDLVRKLKLHFDGRPQDFSKISTDPGEISDFSSLVYEATKLLAPGTVVSYQDICKKIKRPNASRAVGTALGKNPIPVIVPCHRVISSSGKLGGYSAAGGLKTKAMLLELEGIAQINNL